MSRPTRAAASTSTSSIGDHRPYGNGHRWSLGVVRLRRRDGCGEHPARQEFHGRKDRIRLRSTGEGDADNRGIGIAAGKELFGGRGHVVVGYEFQDQNSIDNCVPARDWCKNGQSIFVNSTTAVATTDTPSTFVPIIPGQPHSIIVSDLRSGTTPNGLLSDRRAGATRYQFNDAGRASCRTTRANMRRSQTASPARLSAARADPFTMVKR